MCLVYSYTGMHIHTKRYIHKIKTCTHVCVCAYTCACMYLWTQSHAHIIIHLHRCRRETAQRERHRETQCDTAHIGAKKHGRVCTHKFVYTVCTHTHRVGSKHTQKRYTLYLRNSLQRVFMCVYSCFRVCIYLFQTCLAYAV